MEKPKRKATEGSFKMGNCASSKIWATQKDLQESIDVYFKECDNHKSFMYDTFGKKHTIDAPMPYTVEGLCDTLDCDRETLLNYQKKAGYEAYFGTVKRAKTKIQRNKVERGMTGESKTAMVIFDLKNNHGYVDKSEQDVNIGARKELDKLFPSTEDICEDK